MDFKLDETENICDRQDTTSLELSDSRQKSLIEYEAIGVNSFREVVDDLKEKVEGNQNIGFSVVFLDFDQTLTEGPLNIYRVHNPEISERNIKAFNNLLSIFHQGSVCITTNRGEGLGLLGKIFKTDKMLSEMVKLLEQSDYPGTVPIFLNLKKQVPSLICKREELISHIISQFVNNKKDSNNQIEIYVIEDNSVFGLDRSIFPKEIAKEVTKRLKKEHNIKIDKVNITDYLIKH